MYRVAVLAVVLAVVLADPEESNKKCHRLGQPKTMRCCKSQIANTAKPSLKPDDIKECIQQLREGPRSCEPELCIGKKRGYVSEDGTLDKEAFVKLITEDLKESSSLSDDIKEKCVKSDLDLYADPDSCELKKLKRCVHIQFVNGCKEWDESGSCAGIKDLVKECAKIFA